VTSRDAEKKDGRAGQMLESIGVRPRPTWIRGSAFIEGDEIVLTSEAAEQYAAFDPEHASRLVFDLGKLAELGEVVQEGKTPKVRLVDTDRALEFAEAHGLLWHGPGQVSGGEVRESLKAWFVAGVEFVITTAMYLAIQQSKDEDSAEPVRRYLQRWRDAGVFKRISLSDNDSDLLDYACIQLAERISQGMSECTPTFTAACGLLNDGVKVGEAGDFRFGNDPGSLIGAANYELARLISQKRRIIACKECGEIFIPDDPRQKYHKKCGNRKRQRERRERAARGQ
jgi:hypothetical protein